MPNAAVVSAFIAFIAFFIGPVTTTLLPAFCVGNIALKDDTLDHVQRPSFRRIGNDNRSTKDEEDEEDEEEEDEEDDEEEDLVCRITVKAAKYKPSKTNTP